MENNYFTELNSIDVGDKTEKKNGLTYLSWVWAWTEVKKRYPDANYTIYENPQGWNYFTDGRTAWVKTGVTVNGIEHIEYLPVMDYKNKSIPLENITSFDVNKTIQRSLTKAVARHGLGLYVYAGEDLPEETKAEVEDFKKQAKAEQSKVTKALNKGEVVTPELSKEELLGRYTGCINWLKSPDFKKATNAQIDTTNRYVEQLKKAGLTEQAKEIEKYLIVDDEINF